VYIGDGISDSLVEPMNVTRKRTCARSLLRERNIPCTSFTSFREIERALFR